MSGTLLIQGGRAIDPGAKLDSRLDVLIENGQIAAVQPSIPAGEGMRVLRAEGRLIVPGLVDLHVHFRQPGREDKETIETGSLAAVRGGYTLVCPMPNTDPVVDHGAAVEWVRQEARRIGLVDVAPIGALSRGQRGEELTDFGELFEAGCAGLSDDGRPLLNPQLMRRALEYAKLFKRPVIQHAEDPSLSAGGVMHEGRVSMVLGLRGIPAESESAIVARDIELAALTGGWIHFAHLSGERSVELVRQAKQRGIRVTCEVTPHHLALTDDAVEGFNTHAKVNPPMRTERDRQALIEGLKDGTIDCIATDHAPHTDWEKATDFDAAPFGISGLETALGVCVKMLVEPGLLSWSELVRAMATAPAQIAGRPGHGIAKGQSADLAIVDPQARWTVDPAQFVSKGRHSPFTGWELAGRVLHVVRRGRLLEAERERPPREVSS